MGDDSPTDRKPLIDYNVGVFRDALQQIFQGLSNDPEGTPIEG